MPKTNLLSEVKNFYFCMDARTRNVDCAGHWWDHIARVVNNAQLITNVYTPSSNSELIFAAALCHDIAYLNDKKSPTASSAKRCEELMLNSGYNESSATFARELILSTDRDVKYAENIDERIVYIADKLDLFGIDGTIRLLIEHGKKGITVRDELARTVAERQKNWFDYMMSMNVAQEFIKRKYSISLDIIKELEEQIVNLDFR